MTAPATCGTFHSRTATPTPCCSRNRITPAYAASPNALPPVRSTAWRIAVADVGPMTSVWIVAGAPPPTWTPAVAAPSQRITVQPVMPTGSVQCPTVNPGGSVMRRVCHLGAALLSRD